MPLAPTDTLEQVVTVARTRVNDTIQSAGGDVFVDSAVFAIWIINGAWRRLQEELAANHFSDLVNEAIITNLNTNTSSDIGLASQLNWTGYTARGGSLQSGAALPQDLTYPLRVWERNSGAGQWYPMEYAIDGLQGQPNANRNYQWEWRDQSIFMSGTTSQSMDLKVRYASFLPDFVPSSTTVFSSQTVTIIHALDAFAWLMCSELANSRGDLDGASFDTKAADAIKRLLARDANLQTLRAQWVIPDIPAAAGNTPLDTVSTMLNTVKARMNALAKAGGDVVTSSQAFTQQCVNTGWRRMQENLLAQKFSRLFGLEVLIEGIPVTVTSDPGVVCSITWTGYQPGNGTFNTSYELPQGLIRPLRVWERVNGSNAGFTPMEFTQNGLPNQPKQARNYAWEWNGDSLNIPGSTSIMDLRIRYAGLLGDFVNGSVPWYEQTIPISRALDALAWYTCFEIASARPDLGLDVDAIAGIQTKAETACTQLVAKDQQAQDLRGEQTVPDIPVATGATPEDTAATVLNVARARLSAVAKAAGDTISAGNPFTQQYFNTAWRKFQEFLADRGFVALTDETIITAMPIVTNTDPASQVTLSWAGFFDGTAQQSSPVLPSNLMFPMKIWERPTGQNACFPVQANMENMSDGLPACQKVPANRFWEWRANAVYMPGSLYSQDLRIRFAKYLPDFIQVGSATWYSQTVGIPRCSDALSLYVCAEVARARPDLEMDPASFQAEAETAAVMVMNRDFRAKQRVNIRRQSHSGRLEGCAYGGYATGY